MNLRSFLPEQVRQPIRRAYVAIGKAAPGLRCEPDFIVIGAQRCGTTSLFRALNQHTDIVRPTFSKGVNYFDLNYDEGPGWYAGHFPTRHFAGRESSRVDGPVAFEASGYYMFHPLAVPRLASDLPNIKLVAMLRDPVERAYSAWKHERARGFEHEAFEQALALEDERLDGEVDKMIADHRYQSHAHRHQAYRRRGEYARLLESVVEHIPRERVHVMYSESFFASPEQEFGRLCSFLDVADPVSIEYERHNARPSRSMPEGAREQLRRHFEPLDAQLAEFVGHAPPWGHGRTPSC